MQIAILLFNRFTMLDAVGPYQVLSRLPGADVVFAAQRPGRITDDMGSLVEYDPQPPYDAGSPAKAPAEILARLRSGSRFVPTAS